MKNTDIALVILIAAVSVVVSYFLGNAILGDPNDRVVTVSYMDKISNAVEQPDVETFNATALNPTVEVYVGNCGPMEVWDATARKCRSKVASQLEDEEDSDDEENIDSEE